jgi:hypothetical protein
VKYLNTYRLFESVDDIDINQVIFELTHLNNDSSPGFDIFSEADDILFDSGGHYVGLVDGENINEVDFYDKISYDGLMKADIDVNSLTDAEKSLLRILHKKATQEFDLSSMPSFSDVMDSLVPLYDLAQENGISDIDVVSIAFDFDDKECHIDVSLFQKLKTIHKKQSYHTNDYEFDMELYNQINDEIMTLYGRLKDKYNVNHQVRLHDGNTIITLLVSI